MSQAAFSVDQVLKTPFPSFHKPLELARALNRSGTDARRVMALDLLHGLRAQYPHLLAIGQELVLALVERNQHDRAETELKALEHTFANLDEESLCRWGRLFKDRGDDCLELPGAVSNRFAPNPERAEAFYRRSLEKYDEAYRIRWGHYPGINKATLLLVLGSLKALQPGHPAGSSTSSELLESAELAGKLLGTRAAWITDGPTTKPSGTPPRPPRPICSARSRRKRQPSIKRRSTARRSTITHARRCAARSTASLWHSATWASRSPRPSTIRPHFSPPERSLPAGRRRARQPPKPKTHAPPAGARASILDPGFLLR